MPEQTKLYYFVGVHAEIGGKFKLTLNRLGQTAQFTDEQYREFTYGGVALLTADEWTSCGFTEQEVSLYARPGDYTRAPLVTQQKINATRALFAKKYATLRGLIVESDEPVVVPTPVEEKKVKTDKLPVSTVTQS